VPDDLSVAGFDNDPFVTAFLPNLTTAVLPHEAMARWAVKQVFDSRHGKHPEVPPLHRIECQLVRRKSIARPRGSALGARERTKVG
jgi:LacI family transcriptional regulator